MIKKLKFLLVVAMVALVPLRAFAAVNGGLCAGYSDGVPGSGLVAHQHGAGADHTSPESDSGALSACSLCTTCCTGASFAPDARAVLSIASPNLELIPFFGRDPGTPHPDKLERPPLSR